YYPEVWCDEVWFSEPAVNLVNFGTFSTTVYAYQPSGSFPTVNCPLYPMALVPWLKIVGTSVLAVRSFNYVLMACAAHLVWVICRRFGIVKSALGRVLVVAVLELSYGMSFCYRCARPDILGLTSVLLLALCLGARASRWRLFCLAV